MEQFRQIGEVLGSLNAIMLLQEDTQINKRQCSLLLDIFSLAFNTIAEEIRLNLKLEERRTKWKALEQPLRGLHRVFKEGEHYVKLCMDRKDWSVKAFLLHQNKEAVEFHIHNLLSCFPAVIEAIETAGEISGVDQDEMQRRKVALAKKYDKEWNDPKLFQLLFGKQYLVPKELCGQFDSAWREDRWSLVEELKEKKISGSATKNEQRLADLLVKKILGSEAITHGLPPSSVLYGWDYQVRRRLGRQYKEIQWLGESFTLRHFLRELEPTGSEISALLLLYHPNILQYIFGFYDKEKKEVLLVMELMSKDLSIYMKENSGSRRQILFPLAVVVDIMFQIARGMEFLHSRNIHHGDLNPSNVLLKERNNEGYFHVKLSGFGFHDVKTNASSNMSQNQNESNPFIWLAPEVLAEEEQPGNDSSSKYSEKADVYGFAMICFELLSGKVPFEDNHLQGEKTCRNIRAGERPLFPHTAPKYLANLTKRCWHNNPAQRPRFSSICRILRYVKKFLMMNPDHDQQENNLPVTDYYDVESWFLRKFTEGNSIHPPIARVPFEMFAYRLAEKDKSLLNCQDKARDLTCEGVCCKDEIVSTVEDPCATSDTKSVVSDAKSVCSGERSIAADDVPEKRSLAPEVAEKRPHSKVPEHKKLVKKQADVKAKHSPGTPTGKARSSTLNQGLRNVKTNRGSRSPLSTSSSSPTSAGKRTGAPDHISD